MSNIEEMEKHKSLYCRDYPKANIWMANFMENVIDELKDLHEENTKLQSEVAKHSEYIKNLKKEIKELKNENNL